MRTGDKRRITDRCIYGNTAEFCIAWTSKENKQETGHSLTLLNPTLELIQAARKAWNETEGKLLRWKTAEEIIEEELAK